jgi:hypothetical protein
VGSPTLARKEGLPRHPDLFTAEEAAAYLRLEGPRSIQRLRQQGRLKPVDLGCRNLYHRVGIDACVASRVAGHGVAGETNQHPVSTATKKPSPDLSPPGRDRRLSICR